MSRPAPYAPSTSPLLVDALNLLRKQSLQWAQLHAYRPVLRKNSYVLNRPSLDFS